MNVVIPGITGQESIEKQRSEKDIALDNEYVSKPVDLNKSQEGGMKTFGFKPFVIPTQNSEFQEDMGTTTTGITEQVGEVESDGEKSGIKESVDIQLRGPHERIEDPAYPIIKNLNNKGLINGEERILIEKCLMSGMDINESTSQLENSEKQTQIIDVVEFSEKESTKPTCLENFNKDCKDLIGKKDERSPKEQEVLDLVGQSYLTIPDVNGEKNITEDLNGACEKAINVIIKDKHFPRTDNYYRACDDVLNGGFETQLIALTYIHSLVNTAEGIRGKSSLDKVRNHNIKKEKYLQHKIEQIEVQLNENKINAEERGNLEEKLSELQISLETEDFPKGEIIAGGKIDGEIASLQPKNEQTA